MGVQISTIEVNDPALLDSPETKFVDKHRSDLSIYIKMSVCV